MTVADQARAFLGMMLCGACMGMVHDLLNVLRQGKLLTAAADLMLGVSSAVGIIATGLLLECDPFRLYTLPGAALGWMIYSASLGMGVRYLREKINMIVKKSKKICPERKKTAGECKKETNFKHTIHLPF